MPIWFRLPSQHLDAVTESADPFLLASLFPAMRHGHRLHVHGQASFTLLRNLEELQTIWTGWCPGRYRAVDLIVDDEVDVPGTGAERVVLAFSGGMDSCFSAWRHTGGECGRARRNLLAGVMVHGFDIPLSQPDIFERAAENSRRILDSVSLELISVACNLRQLGTELGVEWQDAHGALIASCLHLLSGRYTTGLIASSHAFDALRFPWGSNAVTDPMLSSAGFSVINDAGGYGRVAKARGVAEWDEAMRRLRVCYIGPNKDRNCGQCPRCVYTALCFAVVGARQPDSLPVESLERAAKGLAHEPLKPFPVTRLQALVADARAASIEDPWVDALDRVVRSHRRWARVVGGMPWLAKPRGAWHLLRSPRRWDRLEARIPWLSRLRRLRSGTGLP